MLHQESPKVQKPSPSQLALKDTKTVDIDIDDLSSLGGGTEDLGTEDGEEDYVERVVLSARQAVWSEAEAWVDAAEKIALSLHDDDDDDDDDMVSEEGNVLYGSDDGLSMEGDNFESSLVSRQRTSASVMFDDGCGSIDEDSDTAFNNSPLRGSASKTSAWDYSPRSLPTTQRSPFNSLSHRRKGDGIGNMKANPLLLLHPHHSQGPLLRGAEAKIVSSSKDVLWRRNVADREQVRAERMQKAESRRRAAYAKAMENQEINKKKLDASAERAAAVVSREQKKNAAFAINNNQKVALQILSITSLPSRFTCACINK
jgi:hypothetical protein